MDIKRNAFIKKLNPAFAGIALFCLATVLTTNVYCRGNEGLNYFDNIITKEHIIGKYAAKYSFALNIKIDPDIKNYIFEYQFKKKDPLHHYICSISVAQAGKYIDPAKYQIQYNNLKDEYKRSFPNHWQQKLQLEFPKIGARAQWGHIVAGPGGAASTLKFTTSDEKYDIKTLISNLLPESVDSPDLELEQIAKAISDNYNKTAENR